MARASGVPWTRDQRLIALNLYCKLPFGRLHKANPIIIEIAQKMGRTPSSLALKLCNFASLDPVLRARGIAGMKGAANEDRAIWSEFEANLPTLGLQSEDLLHDLLTDKTDKEVDLLDYDRIKFEPSLRPTLPSGPTESTATVRVEEDSNSFVKRSSAHTVFAAVSVG